MLWVSTRRCRLRQRLLWLLPRRAAPRFRLSIEFTVSINHVDYTPSDNFYRAAQTVTGRFKTSH